MKKQLYCQYDPTYDLEKSIGALRIYVPAGCGYINYNIAHGMDAKIVCDTWRLSRAFTVDDACENPCPLNPQAEWDMALRIHGRDDFIGGMLHGDEIFSVMRLFVDEIRTEMSLLSDLTPFTTLRMQVESVGYDPDDHKTEALNHFKEYIMSADGVAIEQKVAWLNDYRLDKCYMAMMPPFKAFTDSYFTDTDPRVKKITTSRFEVEGCRSATLFGAQSRLVFHMSVPKYPSYETGNRFFVSDNNGRPYHKMYFPVCCSAEVTRGEIWETRTEYAIQYG